MNAKLRFWLRYELFFFLRATFLCHFVNAQKLFSELHLKLAYTVHIIEKNLYLLKLTLSNTLYIVRKKTHCKPIVNYEHVLEEILLRKKLPNNYEIIMK